MKINFKKIFAYCSTFAQIISFISLTLSVVIKVKSLISSSSKSDDDDDSKPEGDKKTESEED